MSKKISSVIIYISILTAVTFWGFSFIWTNSLLQQGFPVYSLVFFRMLFAAIILSIVSFTARKIEKVDKKDYGWFLLLVLLEPFIYFLGETFGLQILNSPTISSIIISTIPLFAMIAGIVFYKERVGIINVLGIIITLPGILLVVFEKGGISVDHYIGILLLFVAVFAAVGYSVVVKRLAGKYNSYTIVTYQHTLGALYFLPFFLFSDLQSLSLDMFTWSVLSPLLFLAILCSCVAFILFINSIKVLGVARANIFTTLVPAISAIGAFLLGHEDMSFRKALGITVVIAGVIIAQWQKKSAKELAD